MNARNLVMKSRDSTNEILYLLAFKNKNPPKRSSDYSIQWYWGLIYWKVQKGIERECLTCNVDILILLMR